MKIILPHSTFLSTSIIYKNIFFPNKKKENILCITIIFYKYFHLYINIDYNNNIKIIITHVYMCIMHTDILNLIRLGSNIKAI